jgi:hypothetical protein
MTSWLEMLGMGQPALQPGTGTQMADTETDWLHQQGLMPRPMPAASALPAEPSMLERLGHVAGGVRHALFGDTPSVWDQMKALSTMEAQGQGHTPEARHAMMDIASNFNFTGMFAGPKAVGAPLGALEHAQTLESGGTHPRDIWGQTGWLKGADGKWRWEIDDSGAKPLDTPQSWDSRAAASIDAKDQPIATAAALQDVFHHPELAKAYWPTREASPEVYYDSLGGTKRGRFQDNTVTLDSGAAVSAPVERSVMLHELQHAIQNKEGFATGGSPDILRLGSKADRQAFSDAWAKINAPADRAAFERYVHDPESGVPVDKAYEQYVAQKAKDAKRFPNAAEQQWVADYLYRNSAGEAEARATQARANMTAEQRRAVFPYDSYGVPPESLIVRMGQVGPQESIKAFHGSPHTFDAFDSSKIGTGEGAQAYGHGLYFAESPGVAKSYQEQLSAGRGAGTADVAARILDAASGDKAEALRIVAQRRKIGNMPDAQQHWDAVQQVLEGGDPRGSLYDVTLAPEPEDFLHWDKPLSEQSAGVREKIDSLRYPNGPLTTPMGLKYEERSGADIYHAVADALRWKADSGPEAASAALRDAGIPGIRYLDAGSRGSGDGTHNIVLFDPAQARIDARNGQPVGQQQLETLGGGEGQDAPGGGAGQDTLLDPQTAPPPQNPAYAQKEPQLGSPPMHLMSEAQGLELLRAMLISAKKNAAKSRP